MLNVTRILSVITIACLLSSCSIVVSILEMLNKERTNDRLDQTLIETRLEMLNKSTDDEIADAFLEKVVESIKDKDKDVLKALFSENALNQADDFDGNADYLFEFIQGEITSWKKSSGPTVFDSVNKGHTTKEISSYYYVSTDKQEYFFLMEEIPIDTKQPDNVGLSLLLVVKADDRLKVYDIDQKIFSVGEQEILRFGVYLPFR